MQVKMQKAPGSLYDWLAKKNKVVPMLSADKIISTFVVVDDFLMALTQQQPQLIPPQARRGFPCQLIPCEIITICLLFQLSGFRNFKTFYLFFKQNYIQYFPRSTSYSRFVTVKKDIGPLLFVFLNSLFGRVGKS